MALIQPYATQHANKSGPGDSRPDGIQVIKDQGLVNSSAYKNKVVLVTGGTSGIGIETARALALTGAKVYITARDQALGDKVAADIVQSVASEGVHTTVKAVPLHLDSLDSVRACAKSFLAQESHLNILILNAGIMACEKGTTADGFETQFGTNHLGHFLLFSLLRDALIPARPDFSPSRVVVVSSAGHKFLPNPTTFLSDLSFEKEEYNPWVSYSRSKMSNIWFANELDRRYKDKGIRALSLHPGSINTNLTRHLPPDDPRLKVREQESYQKQVKSVGQGAATSVFAAVAKELEGKGGLYLDDVGMVGPVQEGAQVFEPGYVPAAFDPETEGRLWRQSCGLVGVEA